jgi:hypothetical protein
LIANRRIRVSRLQGKFATNGKSRVSDYELKTVRTIVTWEIFDQLLPERVHRKNPRVVKKPVSKFRSKQVKHRGTGIIMNPPVVIILSTA